MRFRNWYRTHERQLSLRTGSKFSDFWVRTQSSCISGAAPLPPFPRYLNLDTRKIFPGPRICRPLGGMVPVFCGPSTPSGTNNSPWVPRKRRPPISVVPAARRGLRAVPLVIRASRKNHSPWYQHSSVRLARYRDFSVRFFNLGPEFFRAHHRFSGSARIPVIMMDE